MASCAIKLFHSVTFATFLNEESTHFKARRFQNLPESRIPLHFHLDYSVCILYTAEYRVHSRTQEIEWWTRKTPNLAMNLWGFLFCSVVLGKELFSHPQVCFTALFSWFLVNVCALFPNAHNIHLTWCFSLNGTACGTKSGLKWQIFSLINLRNWVCSA